MSPQPIVNDMYTRALETRDVLISAVELRWVPSFGIFLQQKRGQSVGKISADAVACIPLRKIRAAASCSRLLMIAARPWLA